MLKLTAHGNLVCNSEIEMDYQGMRHEKEQFIYIAQLGGLRIISPKIERFSTKP